MTIQEPTTVGLSKEAHEELKLLKENGHFAELQDAYRFAISLAIAQGVDPLATSVGSGKATIFNIGTLDGDQSIKLAISSIYSDQCKEEPVYKIAERLAEWGINELAAEASRGEINFIKLLEQAEEKLKS